MVRAGHRTDPESRCESPSAAIDSIRRDARCVGRWTIIQTPSFLPHKEIQRARSGETIVTAIPTATLGEFLKHADTSNKGNYHMLCSAACVFCPQHPLHHSCFSSRRIPPEKQAFQCTRALRYRADRKSSGCQWSDGFRATAIRSIAFHGNSDGHGKGAIGRRNTRGPRRACRGPCDRRGSGGRCMPVGVHLSFALLAASLVQQRRRLFGSFRSGSVRFVPVHRRLSPVSWPWRGRTFPSTARR